MEPITTTIVTSIATGILANFSTDAVKKFFNTAFLIKPELEQELKTARTSNDIEAIFKEAVDVIDASASSGEIRVNGAILEALRGIRFDHEHGTVNISGTRISSKVLVTGGGRNATGKTTIGENTEMKSQGTSIQVGQGCSIVMTGGATIRQT